MVTILMERKMHKHGLAVMRCQPFHNGHKRIVDRMLKECEKVTIVLGSIDKKDKRNPFPFHDRKKMIKNIYNDGEDSDWFTRIVVLGVPDINNDLEWARYILKSVEDHYVDNRNVVDYVPPDAYYTGSKYDARWYIEKRMKINLVDRTDKAFPLASATMIRDLCEYGDDRWKDYTPEKNHELIDKWVTRIQFLAHY